MKTVILVKITGSVKLVAALLLAPGLLLLGLPLLGPAAWWQVGVSGVGAALTMGWYLLRAHPVLRRELRELQWGENPT